MTPVQAAVGLLASLKCISDGNLSPPIGEATKARALGIAQCIIGLDDTFRAAMEAPVVDLGTEWMICLAEQAEALCKISGLSDNATELVRAYFEAAKKEAIWNAYVIAKKTMEE